MIRILIVDDQNVVRQGLEAMLGSKPKLEVVGTAKNGSEALEQVRILRPDLVLIDIEMPKVNGITATEKICQLFPETKVLVLSSYEDEQYAAQAFIAGARGYLFKSTLSDDLEQAIWSVYRGYSQLEPKLLTVNCSQNILNSAQSSKNKLPLKISESTLKSKPIFERPLSETKKLLVTRQKTSEVNALKTEKETKKPLVSEKAYGYGQKLQFTKQLSKNSVAWIVGLIIAASAIAGIIVSYNILQLSSAQKNSSQPSPIVPPLKKVTALGRLEPEAEVIHVAAPLALDEDRLEQLLVKEGDRVSAGQIIAVLDSKKSLQNNVSQAKQLVKKAQTQLAKVKAGAKIGEIMAQKAVIARIKVEKTTEVETQKAEVAQLKSQLANSEIEYQRHQVLFQNGAISASIRDSKELALKILQQQFDEAKRTLKFIQNSHEQELKEAEATLDEIAEVRLVDLQEAQAEIDSARVELRQAQTNLEQSYIRAPIEGLVLKIQTRPGAKIGDEGIVSMAQTNQMITVAEIYETDISKIRLGQKAIITSQAFSGQLQGQIYHIDSQVSRQNLFNNQPAENLARRVIEIKIRLTPKDSKKVENLTNLEVQTSIVIDTLP